MKRSGGSSGLSFGVGEHVYSKYTPLNHHSVPPGRLHNVSGQMTSSDLVNKGIIMCTQDGASRTKHNKKTGKQNVTSTSQHPKKLMKNQKMCESIWPTWQVVEIKKENKKSRKTPPPHPNPSQPPTRTSRKKNKTGTSKVGAISKAQKKRNFLKFVKGGTLSTF